MDHPAFTDSMEVEQDRSLFILAEDNDQIKRLEELGKTGVKFSSANEERSHPSLIHGDDLICVEFLLDELKNSWKAHHYDLASGKSLTKCPQSRQSKNKIAECPLVNDEHGVHLRLLPLRPWMDLSHG